MYLSTNQHVMIACFFFFSFLFFLQFDVYFTMHNFFCSNQEAITPADIIRAFILFSLTISLSFSLSLFLSLPLSLFPSHSLIL